MARIGYLGTPELAVAPLKAILDAGHEVPLVISTPDVRRGRGSAVSPSPVKTFALERGLAVSDDLAALEGVGLDLCVVVAYGRIIPTPLLENSTLAESTPWTVSPWGTSHLRRCAVSSWNAASSCSSP